VLDHANSTVKPLQKPTPPIWIGANADVAIRRAARLGDCWYINPHSTLTTLARQMEVYKRALDEFGKPFPAELPMRREVFVARTREEAIRLARPYLEVKYKTYREWGQDKVMPAGDDFVNHLVASVHWPGMPNSLALEQMQILAEEVMPAVRRAA
jgi:alkanesulfonate monooxygenase SsuD/methylene tetrahydromethanopterin reductase-like flavin-dependent oxidoreductase (luciferase family)